MLRIKELRISQNFTQKDLAEKLSTTQTTIGKYERGELEVNFETLQRLADLFECSIDYLLGRSDDFGNVTVRTDGIQLTADEERLLNTYRRLTEKNKMHVSAYAQVRLEEQDGSASSSLRWK